MKKLTQKILAGILSLAMVIGCFSGMGTLEAKAGDIETNTLTIKLLDENGKGISGQQLTLHHEYGDDISFGNPTANDGTASYMWFADESSNEDMLMFEDCYTIQLDQDSQYQFKSDADIEICFKGDGAYNYQTDESLGDELVFQLTNKNSGDTFDNTILKVQVTDNSQPPVSVPNLKLRLTDVSGNNVLAEGTTDAEGIFTLNPNSMENPDSVFDCRLRIAPGQGYTMVGAVQTIKVKLGSTGSGVDKKWFVEKVNDVAYTSMTTFQVEQKAEPEVGSIVTDPSAYVSNQGQEVKVTVKGNNLPEKLYYKLFYIKNANEKPMNTTATEVTADVGGSGTERTFSVSVPSVEENSGNEWSGAEAWKIGVGVLADGSDIVNKTKSKEIAVVETITAQQLQAIITKAKSKDQEEYGPDGWTAYSKVIEDAEALLASGAVASEVDFAAAKKKIEEAEQALEAQRIPENEKYRSFKASILDKDGNPISDKEIVSKLKFFLVNTQNADDTYEIVMNENDNTITVSAENINSSGIGDNGYTEYALRLTNDSGYTCTQNIFIRFSMGEISKKMYVSKVFVDGSAPALGAGFQPEFNIAGSQVIPKVTGVATTAKAVSDDGTGQVQVAVKGTDLTNELYYYLTYVKTAGSQQAVQFEGGKRTKVTANGSSVTDKTITVTLPAKPADAYAWKINVAATLDGTAVSTDSEIRIVTPTTESELREAIDAATKMDSSDYTEESWTKFLTKITEIRESLGNGATELECGAALADINAAKNLLVSVADKTIEIQVVGEDGQPIKGMQLELQGAKTIVIKEPTDDNGKTRYIMDGTEIGTYTEGSTYDLLPKEESGYICDPSSEAKVIFTKSGEDYSIQELRVGSEKIDMGDKGYEVILKVKEEAAEITSVVPVETEIGKEGGKVRLTVRGTRLPEKLYYDLWCEKQGGGRDQVLDPTEMQGTGDERIFEVILPSAAQYPKALRWGVSVSTVQELSGERLNGMVRINDPVAAKTKEDLKALAEEKITEKDYTTASWDVYNAVIKEAMGLLENEYATETACQTMFGEIESAKNALVRVVTEDTKEAIAKACEDADKLTAATYTAESWKVYEDAILSARKIIENDEASEAECQEALKAINTAKAALVVRTAGNTETAPPSSKPPIQAGTIETTGSGIFEVTNASERTVAFKTSNKSAKKITVPSAITMQGVTYKVTKIDNNAFAGSKKLTKVTIPASVTEIGTSAFKNCTKLTGITIPKNVKKIGKNAFAGCKKLKKITVRSGKIKTIGKKAFKGVSKKTVIKVPKKKKVAYKKLFKKSGFKGRVK